MRAEFACQVRGLAVAYRHDPVLRDVDLDVPSGVTMGIVGPNGAGKSTLIKAMLGLVPPLLGTVTFYGRPLAEARRDVGYMPQAASVDWDFPTTVADVVTMGTYGTLGWFRRPGRSERDRAVTAMRRTAIEELSARQIGELSGGQRQRVFLARTLAQGPRLYVMDEPFAGIDAKSQRAILTVMEELRDAGSTILLVHHDLVSVRRYCDYVTVLNRTVISSGPTEQALTPAAIRTAYDLDDDTPIDLLR